MIDFFQDRCYSYFVFDRERERGEEREIGLEVKEDREGEKGLYRWKKKKEIGLRLRGFEIGDEKR